MLISVIRTLILYVFIIIAIRLMGKRQISDMQPSELVVTMVISDIASLPMQNTSQPLLSGVIPVTILVALFGGWIWSTLGIETLFILSAVLGLCNSAYAATIKVPKKVGV